MHCPDCKENHTQYRWSSVYEGRSLYEHTLRYGSDRHLRDSRTDLKEQRELFFEEAWQLDDYQANTDQDFHLFCPSCSAGFVPDVPITPDLSQGASQLTTELMGSYSARALRQSSYHPPSKDIACAGSDHSADYWACPACGSNEMHGARSLYGIKESYGCVSGTASERLVDGAPTFELEESWTNPKGEDYMGGFPLFSKLILSCHNCSISLENAQKIGDMSRIQKQLAEKQSFDIPLMLMHLSFMFSTPDHQERAKRLNRIESLRTRTAAASPLDHQVLPARAMNGILPPGHKALNVEDLWAIPKALVNISGNDIPKFTASSPD